MLAEKVLLQHTFRADATVVAKGYIMKMSGTNAGNVAIAAAGNSAIIGVSMDKARPVYQKDGTTVDSYNVTVGMFGIGHVLLGGTVTAGGYLKSDASGKCVAATPAEPGTNVRGVFGPALESGVSGDYIRVYLSPQVGAE